MGERVTPSRQGDIPRARRLKKALDSGAPPAFVQPETVAVPTNGAFSERDSAQPPFPDLCNNNQYNAEIRLQFLEQMFQALPNGLSIADSSHRVLWANETFSRIFDYTSAEVVGQPLENLVVPPDRLAESRWVSEALARGERI